MTELKVFENEQFGKLSVMVIKEKPWFIAKQITEILGYKDAESMTRRLDEDEKMLLTIDIAKSLQIVGFDIPTRGMTMINESGLYSAILGSSKTEAKPFKKWITSDLLPTIRKTGGYVANEDLFINTYLPFADDVTKQLFSGILTTVRNQNEIISKQRNENSQLVSKNVELEKDNVSKHKLIDAMTESYDGTYIRMICVDYVNKTAKQTGIHQSDLYSKVYKLVGRAIKKDLTIQFENFTNNEKLKVKENMEYNRENKLKGLDRKSPYLIKDSKANISKVEFVCDVLGQGNVMLEAMSKVFEVGIEDIIEKYNIVKIEKELSGE